MKKIFYLILSLSFGANSLIAQVDAPINIDLQLALQNLENTEQTEQILPVLVQGNLARIEAITRNSGGTYKYGLKNFASVNAPISAIRQMIADPDIQRIEYYQVEGNLLGDYIQINNNLDSLHQGLGALPQGLDGEGVMVGIIDNGIEWKHPDLQNPDGTTRIKYIWDQDYPSSNMLNYGYGFEWTESQLNDNTALHNSYTYPTYGHGNGTAGVAVGNGSAVAGKYIGAAPKADIIHVNIDFTGFYNNFVDAVHYIFSKADASGQPCVINSSVGNYRGPHDTRGLEVKMIEAMLDEKPGRVLVQAAGNGGGIRQHLGYEVTTDTVFSWLKTNLNTLGYVYFDLYADKADFDDVYFSLGMRDKTDFTLHGVTNFFNLQTDFPDLATTGMDALQQNLYDANGNLLGEIEIYVQLYEGVYDMAFKVIPSNTADYWELTTTGSGKFDIWSNGSLMGTSSIVPPTQAPDATVFPDIEKHIFADTLKSIVSGWNCSPKVISVANYSNRSDWEGYDGETYYNSVPAQQKALNSSVGPTRTGVQKPNIAASGNFTFALQELGRLDDLANDPSEADRLAPEGWHVRWSGTSIAAPVLTGTVACYLQQFPNATYEEVKLGIENSAKVDDYVTALYGATPNDGWGYGKLDGFNFVNNAVLAVGVDAPMAFDFDLQNTPNPFQRNTHISYRINDVENVDIRLQITDAMGRNVQQFRSNKSSDTFLFDASKLSVGTYFCTLRANDEILQTRKMMKVK